MNKDFLTKTLTDTVLSRRSFLKWSAALGGSAVLAGGFNYGLKAAEAAAEAVDMQGKWIPAACWHNCGGRCFNLAYVKDGVIIQQKTDDTHADSPDYPQQRGCARGRSQRQQVFGADRIKYPMKRKNWEPGGGKKELRGKDEWVRISWDEALDLVASELKRIKEKYGNASILTPRHESRLLNAWGGSMSSWGVTSAGAFPQVQALMAGNAGVSTNDRLDYRNARLVVLWGSNPSISSGGNPAYNYRQAKQAGAKFIFVDPRYSETMQSMADEWIPCRPGTDTALLLGMAYHMIKHNLQDQNFLDTYCVGFDRQHMPEGADPKENFKDYVLGTYDGQPKTPEWASARCGTDPDLIRQFAQEVASVKPMIWTSSWSPSRTERGEQYVQAFLTVGWMTGNVGKSGSCVGVAAHSSASYGGASLVRGGGTGLPGVPNPLSGGVALGYAFSAPENTEFNGIAYEEMWDAVLKNEYHATVRGILPCDIRMIYIIRSGTGSNSLNQVSGVNKGIDAFRKVEFVVTNDIVLSTVSKYADIVLPAQTLWEKEYGGFLGMNVEALMYYQQVTQPLFEAKDEIWMEMELAKRLDMDPNELYPLSKAQMFFNQLAGAKVITKDGSAYESLVTITADDIKALGVEGEPQTGRITWKEYMEKGSYQVPREPGDAYTFVANKAFVEDPVANPLKTATGKLEIHCKPLVDKIAAYGFTKDLAPVSQYVPPVEGVESTFKDWNAKTKGKYPLQLYTIHYYRRSHSVFDNVKQLREAFPQEFMMNPIDAKARGIKHGDTVLVESAHGKVLRPVSLTTRIMPGVVTLGEGAWVQRDDESGIDYAGCTNSLNGNILTGQGQEPWNTCVVEVKKWDGEPSVPDALWPQRIPVKEA